MRTLTWLWQSVIGNVVSFVCIAMFLAAVSLWRSNRPSWALPVCISLAAAAPVVLLTSKRPAWATPLLSGLGAAALAIVVCYCVFVIPAAIGRTRSPRVTPENVEAQIKSWLEHFGLSTRKMREPEATGVVFALDVTLPNGVHAAVLRPRDFDHYVIVRTKILLTSELQDPLNKLTGEQVELLGTEVSVELAKARVDWTGQLSADGPSTIVMERRVPITDGLTEDTFMARLEQIGSETTLAINLLRLQLLGRTKEDVTPRTRR